MIDLDDTSYTPPRLSLHIYAWLMMLVVTLVSLLIGYVIASASLKSSLHEQLTQQSDDHAAVLALSLSQLQKTPRKLEGFIRQTFDSGHFSLLRLEDNRGRVIIERRQGDTENSLVPQWFHRMSAFEFVPSKAVITEDEAPYGVLYVQAQQVRATQALWGNAKLFMWVAVLVLLFNCVLASLFIRWLLEPLKQLNNQVDAIAQKQFTQLPPAKPKEIANLMMAMNYMAKRLSQSVNDSNERLKRAQYLAQHDEVTGLATKRYFLSRLEQQIKKSNSSQMIILVRILNYEQLRDSIDKQEFIEAQQRLANTLIRFAQTHQSVLHEWQLARIEQDEFCIYFDAVMDGEQTSKILTDLSAQYSNDYQGIVQLRHCMLCVSEVESSQQLFDEAHRLLKLSIASGQNVFRILQPTPEEAFNAGKELEIAIKNEQFELAMMKVENENGQCVQYEVGLNIIVGGQTYSRAYFGATPASLELDSQLDWKTVRTLFKEKLWLKYPQNLCIQLSEQTLQDEVAYTSILALIASEPALKQRVTLEFSHLILQRVSGPVMSFCKEAKAIGCHLGLCEVRDANIEPRMLIQSAIDTVKLSNELVYNLENDQQTQNRVSEISAHLSPFNVDIVVEELAHRLPWPLLKRLGIKARVVHE